MTDVHELFPVGMFCCHCQTWHNLAGYVQHVDVYHDGCEHCALDRHLALDLALDQDRAMMAAAQLGVDVANVPVFG